MQTPELKPCPFCGGEAKLTGTFEIMGIKAWEVLCGRNPADFTCGAQVISLDSEEAAIRQWNRRAGDET